jgi:hypothetical protein
LRYRSNRSNWSYWNYWSNGIYRSYR